MPTLWAQTTDFDNISVGDDLPILVKFEFRPPARDGVEAPKETPVDREKLSAYVEELLLKAFSSDSVNHEETSIEANIKTEFLPGDTVSLSGRVAGKSEEDGKRRVNCEVTVESEEGVTVAEAKVAVSL